MNDEIHIAGLDIKIEPNLLRQRCAWCGATLLDYNLDRVAVVNGPEEDATEPATWPIGALIARNGAVSWIVDHEGGDKLPAGSCALLDPEVTA